MPMLHMFVFELFEMAKRRCILIYWILFPFIFVLFDVKYTCNLKAKRSNDDFMFTHEICARWAAESLSPETQRIRKSSPEAWTSLIKVEHISQVQEICIHFIAYSHRLWSSWKCSLVERLGLLLLPRHREIHAHYLQSQRTEKWLWMTEIVTGLTQILCRKTFSSSWNI